MEKIIILIISAALAFSGCSSNNNKNNNDNKAVSKNVETEKDTDSQKELKEEVENTDFKNVKWGMSKEEVRKLEESSVYYEEENFLIYNMKTEGLIAATRYEFNSEDQLIKVINLFLNKHVNKKDYLDDFNKMKEKLTKKYGEPTKDIVDWKDDLYREDESQWGKAIITGGLELATVWENETSRIILDLKGENNQAVLCSVYLSKELVKDE